MLTRDQVSALYIAVYGRAPDTEGMEYWLQANSYAEAAEGFVSHRVFKNEYMWDSNREMVEKFYTNIFGSKGDTEGIAFWTEALNNGLSIAQVLAGFLDASLSADLSSDPEGAIRQQVLKNKVAVANYYQTKLGDDFSLNGIAPDSANIVDAPDFIQAKALIDNTSHKPDTLTQSLGKIDQIVSLGKSEPFSLIIKPDDWSAYSNTVSLMLEFENSIGFEGIGLVGGGSAATTIQTTSTSNKTVVQVAATLRNGTDLGEISLDFSVPSSLKDSDFVTLKNVDINGNAYPDATKPKDGNEIYFPFTAIFPEFKLIDETLSLDTLGYDSYYSNISSVLTLPEAKVGLITTEKPTSAYLHIESGEKFLFDHDTFLVKGNSSGSYRLKITPEEPELFGGNMISWLYEPDGKVDDLIMNLVGNKSTFIDGALYSDVFSIQKDKNPFVTVSLRWNDRENSQNVAEGPAAYQVELVKVVGVNSLSTEALDLVF